MDDVKNTLFEGNISELVEAILFLENDPVPLSKLIRMSGSEREGVLKAIDEIQQRYSSHGIELVEVAGGYCFMPRRYLWEHLKKYYGKKGNERLSRAALETLAIIAYSQPITKAEIESIRGVSADNMIKLLMERNLVRVVGKKDAPGKPKQYGTTKDFLRMFNLKSIADLPKLSEADQMRFGLK